MPERDLEAEEREMREVLAKRLAHDFVIPSDEAKRMAADAEPEWDLCDDCGELHLSLRAPTDGLRRRYHPPI